jgi:hypothetical protein
LKGKVLIKGKRISEDLTLEPLNSQDMYDTDSDDDSEIGDEHRGDRSESSPVRIDDEFLFPCLSFAIIN